MCIDLSTQLTQASSSETLASQVEEGEGAWSRPSRSHRWTTVVQSECRSWWYGQRVPSTHLVKKWNEWKMEYTPKCNSFFRGKNNSTSKSKSLEDLSSSATLLFIQHRHHRISRVRNNCTEDSSWKKSRNMIQHGVSYEKNNIIANNLGITK